MRRVSVALAVGLLLFATAACSAEADDDKDGVATLQEGSGDGSDDSDDDSATTPEEAEEQALEFAQCMRDHGVDMPDPEFTEDGGMRMGMGGGPGEIDRETLDAAMEACEDLQPDMGGRFSEEDRAEMEDRMLAFAECMREHGIDMPDPDFSGDGGVGMRLPEGVDPEDPEFQEAQETCGDEVGMGMGRAPGAAS